jgi:hypothetical protein
MSILSEAQEIRDETVLGANTATRVGGNLVNIAGDLTTKQTAIEANAAAAATNATAIGINATAAATNATAIGINATAAATNATAIVINATAAATNATAILTKLGKSTSTIAVSEVDVLTAAAYTALATKVTTKLYFTT